MSLAAWLEGFGSDVGVGVGVGVDVGVGVEGVGVGFFLMVLAAEVVRVVWSWRVLLITCVANPHCRSHQAASCTME